VAGDEKAGRGVAGSEGVQSAQQPHGRLQRCASGSFASGRAGWSVPGPSAGFDESGSSDEVQNYRGAAPARLGSAFEREPLRAVLRGRMDPVVDGTQVRGQRQHPRRRRGRLDRPAVRRAFGPAPGAGGEAVSLQQRQARPDDDVLADSGPHRLDLHGRAAQGRGQHQAHERAVDLYRERRVGE